MDNSGNNIKLEIEMTNRERGDSVISDIEAALPSPLLPPVTNATLFFIPRSISNIFSFKYFVNYFEAIC